MLRFVKHKPSAMPTSFCADAAPPLPGLLPCSRASMNDMVATLDGPQRCECAFWAPRDCWRPEFSSELCQQPFARALRRERTTSRNAAWSRAAGFSMNRLESENVQSCEPHKALFAALCS